MLTVISLSIDISGMLALDTSEGLEKPRLTNISTPRSLDGDKTHFGPRMNGGMVHIPVGDKGILVQIGGHTTEDYPQYGHKLSSGANARNKNVSALATLAKTPRVVWLVAFGLILAYTHTKALDRSFLCRHL